MLLKKAEKAPQKTEMSFAIQALRAVYQQKKNYFNLCFFCRNYTECFFNFCTDRQKTLVCFLGCSCFLSTGLHVLVFFLPGWAVISSFLNAWKMSILLYFSSSSSYSFLPFSSFHLMLVPSFPIEPLASRSPI